MTQESNDSCPPSPELDDRRPIGARKQPLWIRVAVWLAAKRVSANAISIAGLACGVGAGAALWWTSHAEIGARWFWLVGSILILGRLLANMLDGMVAERSGTISPVGTLYNELPDRLADGAILIGLGLAQESSLLAGAIAATLAITTAYVRALV